MKRFFAFLVVVIALGCEQGREGDRCNPSLSHDECGSNLSCQQPENCPENYCCPISGASTNAFCQPGCNGGLEAICTATQNDAAACSDATPE
jgi:hypothetical protein